MSDDLENASRIQIIREEVKQLCGNCERLTEDEFKEKVLGIMAVGFSFGLNADRPQGEWVKRTRDMLIAQVNFAYCSECGQPIMHEHTRPLWSFCPNCGARMKGADDERHDI